jgi:hypothetical protein
MKTKPLPKIDSEDNSLKSSGILNKYAAGTNYVPETGPAIVGEKGPETILSANQVRQTQDGAHVENLNKGDAVIPANKEYDLVKIEGDIIRFVGKMPQTGTSGVTGGSVFPSISGGSTSGPGTATATGSPGPTTGPAGAAAGASGPPAATSVGMSSATGNDTPDQLSAQVPAVSGSNEAILKTIRQRESNGNYKLASSGSSASGAYQFIDGTWNSLTKQFNIGTEYKRAMDAPPNVQDAVADAYINDILKKNGGDVSKVPLVWYTGNAQGRISDSAIAANNGLTPAMYQSKWLADYAKNGGSVPGGAATLASNAPATGGNLNSMSTSAEAKDLSTPARTSPAEQTFASAAPQQTQPSQQQKTITGEVPLNRRLQQVFPQTKLAA